MSWKYFLILRAKCTGSSWHNGGPPPPSEEGLHDTGQKPSGPCHRLCSSVCWGLLRCTSYFCVARASVEIRELSVEVISRAVPQSNHLGTENHLTCGLPIVLSEPSSKNNGACRDCRLAFLISILQCSSRAPHVAKHKSQAAAGLKMAPVDFQILPDILALKVQRNHCSGTGVGCSDLSKLKEPSSHNPS